MKFLLSGGLEHTVEAGAIAVDAGEVLVAVDGVDVPAVVHGVAGQQVFLVLDALGFGLVFVLVLLAQACIDRAEDLLHLLKGVTAHCYDTAEAVGLQGFI